VNQNRATHLISGAFVVSAVASVSLAVVYAVGGTAWLEGTLLGIALAGIGVGLILWAKEYLPIGEEVQQRDSLEPEPSEEEEAEDALEEGIHAIGRRSLLVKLGAMAAGALGVAALFPIRSLGGRPGTELITTPWYDGVRVVDEDGQPIAADRVEVGQVLTVFPEGAVGSGDAVALVIGLPDGVNQPLPGREDWSVGGLVSYSKLCTHVGCPVGLYEPTSQQLFCPCHQSVFDVPAGANPVGGPAARPLPQLPIDVDDAGYLIATGGFSGAPGAGFWWRPDDD